MTDSGHGYSNRAEGETRLGNWMQTQFGNQFWPLDPRPEDFDIKEIASALGKACRYAGHCFGFYSVAEHSVLVSQIVPPEFALTALMHDATEAYLVDIPRPLKPYLTGCGALSPLVTVAMPTCRKRSKTPTMQSCSPNSSRSWPRPRPHGASQVNRRT
jgi:hypothetical protein